MGEMNKAENKAKQIVNPDKEFSGYTLEEIRYQRVLIALQADFCKNKIFKSFNNLQKANPFSPSGGSSSLTGKVGNVALKLVNGLNYLDYAVLGLSLFKSFRKITSLFKKKNK